MCNIAGILDLILVATVKEISDGIREGAQEIHCFHRVERFSYAKKMVWGMLCTCMEEGGWELS